MGADPCKDLGELVDQPNAKPAYGRYVNDHAYLAPPRNDAQAMDHLFIDDFIEKKVLLETLVISQVLYALAWHSFWPMTGSVPVTISRPPEGNKAPSYRILESTTEKLLAKMPKGHRHLWASNLPFAKVSSFVAFS